MQTQLEARADISVTATALATTKARASLTKRPRYGESLIRGFLLLCGIVSIFTTVGIIVVLGQESLRFFTSGLVDVVEFFTSTEWQPQVGKFGILPLLNATLMTSVAAMLVALPLGIGAAIYLSEYAAPRVRATLKPILEILAGVPTVVYGYFALTFMTPLLRNVFGQDTVQIYNTASAGLVMGIMILPTIASMSEDALAAVPRSLREASYGLGATKFETVVRVVLPAALSGVLAAFLIGMSRAVGETMIVALAAGAGPNFTFNPFQAAETMTGHIARISGGDLSYQSIDYLSLFAVGLTLFALTLGLNLLSRWVSRRFREVYQ
jgi:phosphate transport system permease protein